MDIKQNIREFRDKWYGYDETIFSIKKKYTGLEEIAVKLESSQFAVEIEGYNFECLFKAQDGEYLYVIYDAAHEPGTRLPNFPRWGYYSLLNGSLLCIEDPMYYKYPEVIAGSFYGEKEKSCVALSLDIVKAVCRRMELPDEKVIFLGSSQGGYTCTYAATLMPNTLSIGITPRLYIQNTPFTENFVKCTGIDLDEPDKLHRNDIVYCIKHSKSRHVLIFNIQHDHDWEKHGVRFCDEFGIKVGYGLNVKDNCMFWTYDCAGAPNPHVSYETKSIFVFIDEVSKAFASGTLTDRIKKDALIINECWHDIYDLKRQVYDYRNNQTLLDFLYIRGGRMSLGRKLGTMLNIAIPKRNHNYNFFRYNIMQKNMKLTFQISGIESNVDEFTVGVYDFKSNRRLHFENYSTKKEVVFSCITGENIEGLGLCIYAGLAGRTRDKEFCMGCFEVWGDKL